MKILKELRLLHGYTQKQMAEALDLTPGYYQMLESGQRRLNGDILILLKKAFPEFDINKLFQLETQEYSSQTSEPTFEELIKVCSCVVDFLSKYYDPHTRIEISLDRIDVVQDIMGTKIKDN